MSEPVDILTPEIRVLAVTAWKVTGEDLHLTYDDGSRQRLNIRAAFGQLVGAPLDDQDLANILHGLRASLVPPGEIQRAAAAVDAATQELRRIAVNYRSKA